MTDLRQEARGRECQIRIIGYCNRDNTTTCLCHLGGAGMALKHDDRHAAIGCSSCHDVVDGRVQTEYTNSEIRLDFLSSIIRTQQIWIKEGKM